MNIPQEIIAGKHDNDLNEINDALTQRRKFISYQRGHQLTPGDRVKFISGRPRYIIGTFATVTKIMQTYICVRLDKDVGKFSHLNEIRVPMSMIEKA